MAILSATTEPQTIGAPVTRHLYARGTRVPKIQGSGGEQHAYFAEESVVNSGNRPCFASIDHSSKNQPFPGHHWGDTDPATVARPAPDDQINSREYAQYA